MLNNNVKIEKIVYPYFFNEQELKPNIEYNGQKLIKLVSKNTPAKIINTNPNVPLIVPL
jgi:hypothetical protein